MCVALSINFFCSQKNVDSTFSGPRNENKEVHQTMIDTLDFIDNRNIKFSFVMMSCDTCVPIKNLGYRVKTKLSTKNINRAKNISTRIWLRLLADSTKDWAANLILYDLKEREAFVLSQYDEKRWRKYAKYGDIKHWDSVGGWQVGRGRKMKKKEK